MTGLLGVTVSIGGQTSNTVPLPIGGTYTSSTFLTVGAKFVIESRRLSAFGGNEPACQMTYAQDQGGIQPDIHIHHFDMGDGPRRGFDGLGSGLFRNLFHPLRDRLRRRAIGPARCEKQGRSERESTIYASGAWSHAARDDRVPPPRKIIMNRSRLIRPLPAVRIPTRITIQSMIRNLQRAPRRHDSFIVGRRRALDCGVCESNVNFSDPLYCSTWSVAAHKRSAQGRWPEDSEKLSGGSAPDSHRIWLANL